jgi:predicted RND superfamily exporter protein
MIRKLATAIIRYRAIILLTIGVGTIFFAYESKNIKMAFGGGDIVPQGHPYVKINSKMSEEFGGSHLVAVVLRVKEGDVLTKDSLARLYRIEQKLSDLRGYVPGKTISIVSRKFNQITFSTDEYGYPSLLTEKYQDIVKRVIAGDAEALASFRDTVLNNEQIYGSIVSPDKKGTVLLAGFRFEEDYKFVFENVQEILKQEREANTEFFASGRPIMLGYMDTYLRGILFVFGIAVIVMIGTLYLDFGNLRGVLLPLAGALMSVVWSIGFLAALDFRIDVLSMVITFLLVALAHGHSVQMLSRYYYEFGRSQDRRRAAVEAITSLLKPATTSIGADAIGLAVLILAPFKSVQSMAVVGTVGVLSIYLSSFALIPILMTYLPPMKKLWSEDDSRLRPLFIAFAKKSLTSWRWPIVAGTLAITILAAFGASKMQVGELQSGSPDFWANSPYNQAERVLEGMTGGNLYWISVDGKQERALYDPLLIRDIDGLQRHLESLPEVGYTISYVDALKKVNSAIHEDDPRWELLPVSANAAAELMPMIGGSQGYEDTKDLFSADHHSATISVFLRDRKPGTISKVIGETRSFLAANQKSSATFEYPGGLIGTYAAIIDSITSSEFSSVAIVVISCLAITVLAFRSFVAAVLIFIPLLIGKAITLAFMGWGGIGFFIYTLPVITLGFGLGIDFSLYLLARLKEEIGKSGDFVQGYTNALGTSGRAVLFTGVTMAGGLVTLCLSEMRFQAILGAMLTVVVVGNTLVSLFFFPVLLSLTRPAFIFKKEEFSEAG